jgi:hypothetical protein
MRSSRPRCFWPPDVFSVSCLIDSVCRDWTPPPFSICISDFFIPPMAPFRAPVSRGLVFCAHRPPLYLSLLPHHQRVSQAICNSDLPTYSPPSTVWRWFCLAPCLVHVVFSLRVLSLLAHPSSSALIGHRHTHLPPHHQNSSPDCPGTHFNSQFRI